MYKAFIDDKPLIIDDIYKQNVSGISDFAVMSDTENDFDDVIRKLGESTSNGVVYLSATPLQAWHDFTGRYVLLEAAGGIVKNAKDEVLVIYRKKKWDLPKGKLDYNESPENAALREVEEECGVKDLKLGKEITKTFHTYSEKNKFILKKTHWFTMTSNHTEELIPQSEEGIEKAKWMNEKMVFEKVFANTYESIKDVLKLYFANSDKN